MAYAMTKRGQMDNEVAYEFICDTLTDMNAIENKYRTMGTVAIVLEGDSGGLEVYITGSSKQWVALNAADIGGNSNSGSGLSIYICDSEDIDQVTGLPDIDEPDETTIYLVPASETSGNLYEEYIYANDAWEKFGGGTVNVDLSNLVTFNDKAGPNQLGLVKAESGYGIGINSASGLIYTSPATSADIKTGTQSYKGIAPERQHEAVFYGLAKVAGQDMKNSNNAVGTYTTEAKTAISNMLGVATDARVAALEAEVARLKLALGALQTENEVVLENGEPLSDEQGNLIEYNTPTT